MNIRKSRIDGDPPLRLEKHPVLLPGGETLSLRSRVGHAWSHVRFHVLIPLLAAVGLIGAGTVWELGHLSDLLIHFGGACLVSAIVVFGYELGTKTRSAEKLTLQLVSILYKHVDNVLDASSSVAIRNAMSELCRNDAAVLSEQFFRLAIAVGELSRGGWASQAYVSFVAAFHRELTSKTDLLVDINRGSSGAGFAFDMPDAVTLADNLVGGTMAELTKVGGDYDAVSDVYTWTKLTTFKNIQAGADNVNRRRLFVLGMKSDKDLPPHEIRRQIYSHYDDMLAHADTYEMRITTLDEYRKTDLIQLADAKHLGIFVPREGNAVAFLVRDETVAHFRLSDASEAMREEFHRLWQHAESIRNLDSEVAANVINDYLLAYFVGRMPRNGHYRSVSRLSEWRNANYDRMLKASLDAVAGKHIHVKRVFVISETDRNTSGREKDEIRNFFRRHMQHRRHSKERYDWRLCGEERVPVELMAEVPFALIESSGDELRDQMVIEVARPQRGFQPSPPGLELKLSTLFEDFWSDLGDCEKSLRAEFPDVTDSILSRTQRT